MITVICTYVCKNSQIHGHVQLQKEMFTSMLPWFITACKRNLGQGNMFTPVCHSVHRGSAWSQGGVPGPRGGAWWRHPPERLLLRAVRILLECILVEKCGFQNWKKQKTKHMIHYIKPESRDKKWCLYIPADKIHDDFNLFIVDLIRIVSCKTLPG